jgi:hypothetical protein
MNNRRVKLYEYLEIDTSGLRAFSTTELCKIVDVKRPAFQVWMQEFFSPSIYAPKGQGDSAKWSTGDLIVVKTFQTLIKSGISRLMAFSCASNVGPYIDMPNGLENDFSVWLEVYPDGSRLGRSRVVYGSSDRKGFNRNDYKIMVGVNILAIVSEVKSGIENL